MSVSVLFLFRFWRLLQKAVHIISHTHLLLLLLVLPPPPPPPPKKKKKKKNFCILQIYSVSFIVV